jgi:hypothetical protein
MDPEIEKLRPKTRHLLIDLVRDAGLSVDDWGNYGGGAARAASNPKYCYEWSFHEKGGAILVSIWHSGLKRVKGAITLEDNLRDTASFYADVPNKAVWRKRAELFDNRIELAAAEQLPVRVIICDGLMRPKLDLNARASVVRARQLDASPWAVTLYEKNTGRFILTRGALPGRLVDQFLVPGASESPTEQKGKTGMLFVRDQAVRSHAIARSKGRCEWCGAQGFALDNGSVFLETHHVVPLSESGADTIFNVVALCANHHREAHFGSLRHAMRERLLDFLESGTAIQHQE